MLLTGFIATYMYHKSLPHTICTPQNLFFYDTSQDIQTPKRLWGRTGSSEAVLGAVDGRVDGAREAPLEDAAE